MIKMPRKKKFEVRIDVWLPQELAEFLEDMVRKDVAESLSQALRKCVAVAKTYMPEVSVELEAPLPAGHSTEQRIRELKEKEKEK